MRPVAVFLISLMLGACALGSVRENAGEPRFAFSLDEQAVAAAQNVAGDADPASRIKADVAFLADDALRGREAGTPGYNAAALYVAERFASLGLAPGGDVLPAGSPAGANRWLQNVPLRAVRRAPGKASFHIRRPDGETVLLEHLEDYLIGRSITEQVFDVTAPVVFAGFGVTAPEENFDDYHGLDVDGKIVLAYTGAPVSFKADRATFYGSADYKLKAAQEGGAIGFVTLPTLASHEERRWKRLIDRRNKPKTTWIGADGAPDAPGRGIKATATLSMQGAKRLFSAARETFKSRPAIISDGAIDRTARVDLPLSVSIAGAAVFSRIESANVVGVIEGSDRDLAGEAIVLSAHLDHVGAVEPKKKNGDGIYNGALDNAMGVAAMLDVARAFKDAPPPRRTIIFLATTAEEKGLLGADYFVQNLLPDAKQIVANINLDMPVALSPLTEVIAIGGKRSSLGQVVKDEAAAMDVTHILDLNSAYGIFMRSDHYRFIERGIPSVYLFIGPGNGGGVFADFMKSHYHKPSDDITLPIDYRSAARFARLNYLVARSISQSSAPPKWIDGDFYGEKFRNDQ